MRRWSTAGLTRASGHATQPSATMRRSDGGRRPASQTQLSTVSLRRTLVNLAPHHNDLALTELTEPGPYVGELKAQSSSIQLNPAQSLSKWRTVLRSLLKNRYRTTYRCYSFSETSRHGAFSAAYGASNRHHGGECDLGEGRHRLVGSTSMRSFSVVPLPPRSLSLHDVAVARGVLASTRPTSLHTSRSCRVCVDAAS